MMALSRLRRLASPPRLLSTAAKSSVLSTASKSSVLSTAQKSSVLSTAQKSSSVLPAILSKPAIISSNAVAVGVVAGTAFTTLGLGSNWWLTSCAAAVKEEKLSTTAPSAADTETANTADAAEAVDAAPPPKPEKPFSFWEACKFIWSLVDGRLLLLGCILTVAGVALQLVVPIKSAALLKAAQQGGLTRGAVLSVLGVANLKALLSVGGAACLASAGNQLKRKLRSTLFAAILAQELGWVHTQRSTALIASIESDTDAVGHAVTHSISVGLGSLAKVVGSLVSLTLISPQLTCLVLCLAPPTAVFAAVCARYEVSMRRAKDKASEAAVSSASEIVEKLQTVQAYAQEPKESGRYDALLARHGTLERTLFIFHRAWTTIMQVRVDFPGIHCRKTSVRASVTAQR